MESFLSLPRSAKGGLAVLLAVALLGWGIVAYSAKRQHEDARSLESALATLESQENREAEVASELQSMQERLTAAEGELESSREAVAASLQEKSDVEAKLADLQAELADLNIPFGDGDALTLLDDNSGIDETSGEQAGSVDAETLRARLTTTMTALSAKNATLQQRERALAKAEAEVESAEARIDELEAVEEERDALRARLTETMTQLSAKSATLQQRDREVAKANADNEAAAEEIATLTGAATERDSLRARLTENMTALSASKATVEQKERELASLRNEVGEKASMLKQQEQALAEKEEAIAAVEAELADLSAALEESAAESSSLTAEIDGVEEALSEKEDAIAAAEQELGRLEDEIASAEQRLSETEAELETKQSMVSAQDVEIQGAETSLATIKADSAIAEAKALELKTAVDRQETALGDLAAIKGEIDEAKAELAVQEALLEEKREQVANVDGELKAIRQASTSGSALQSLPRIAIADLNADNLAVLPIDPMQTPIPVQTDQGVRLTLVHFELGSAELTPGALRRAKEAAVWIRERGGDDTIRLVGATDTIGTRENNMALAERRAKSLLSVFEREGIDPDRIELIPMGEDGGSETIADQTAEPLNRCVGVFIGEG